MIEFLGAAGDVVSYAREDEHLQISNGGFPSPEDLSARALGQALSQGFHPPVSPLTQADPGQMGMGFGLSVCCLAAPQRCQPAGVTFGDVKEESGLGISLE